MLACLNCEEKRQGDKGTRRQGDQNPAPRIILPSFFLSPGLLVPLSLSPTIIPMKIYTRTGDDGTTGLFGGPRVRKSDPRIDCYGTVDELNATIGLAAVSCPPDLAPKLRQIQNELFI